MRLRHRDGTIVHLAYCTNVHQAEDIDGVLTQLARYAEPVRAVLDVGRLGVGLWLARDVATALLTDRGALERLRRELAVRGLEVVTLNGFPYGGFHAPVVKRNVYQPDWATARRAAYTLDLARILACLLPDDAASGSISTLPLGWRKGWPQDRRQTACRLLDQLAVDLAKVAEHAGPIRVGFEPEPGCVVEFTGQVHAALGALDPEWFGICLDACHLAVQFEEPAAALARLGGLPVVKAQVSCALRAPAPADHTTRAALARFCEPRFLHQVRTRANGQVIGSDDLGEALVGGLPDADEWRIHFHVPVHSDAAPPLGTTRRELKATLAALVGGPVAVTNHLEVETYTWGVLPDGACPQDDAGLVDGLASELRWTRDRLRALGLEEVAA
jgi:sugar phosphate isomerase/epimerase